MRQDAQLGLAGGALVSLLSWSGNHTPQLVSIFPNGLTFLVLISFFFGVVRIQRREMGSADLGTSIRRILPVGVVCGLVMAVTMALLGTAHFSRFYWMLLGFGVLGAFASCVVWAALVATAAWAVSRRTSTSRHLSGAG
jgi:hypothetical protein